ncbi:MAG TPA: glycosyltransferase [Anaerolineaceae bacterium]|nr:glycosyltransferase [Anaerolineaceae bacterium]
MKFADFLSDRQIFENGHDRLKPQVSVVMPTYARNAEGLLTSCLDSILAQTFTNFEFIIIDDGSSDGSEAVIKQYATADPRIVYVRHPQNSGLPAVRTDEGILLARAPYVAFIFDDNLWYPDALESMVTALEHADVELVYGHVLMPRANADPVSYGITPPTLEILQNANTIPNGVVAVRRSFFDKVGLYDPHLVLRRICDWDLWLRAAKLNIPMGFIDRVLGVEQGIVSPSSLGNTVKLDFKVSLAYMSDDRTLAERCAALTPAAIADYDPFVVEKIIPYTRNLFEWQQLEEEVYTPFFDKHPYYVYQPLLKHNRLYDLKRSHFRVDPVAPLFRHRQRIAIVSNRVTRFVLDWYEALSADLDNIVLLLSQLSFGLVAPQDIDHVILMDICNPVMVTQLEAYTALNVPITFVAVHGPESPALSPSNPTRYVDEIIPELYSRMMGWPIYIPNPGVGWPVEALPVVQSILSQADQVIVCGDSQDSPLVELQSAHTLPFIANQSVGLSDPTELSGYVAYLGDAQALSELTQAHLQKTLAGTSATIYLHPDTMPPQMTPAAKISWQATLDNPAIFVRRLKNVCLLLPVEIWRRLPSYHQKLLLEDLFHNNCRLQLLGQEPPIDDPAAGAINPIPAPVLGLPAGARHLQLRNLILGVHLRRKIATQRQQPHAHDVKTMVLINSQALAGSEAYGLLVGYALHQIGFDVQVSTHASYDPYPQGLADLGNWLSEHGLPPLVKAEYGKVVRTLQTPDLPEAELQVYAAEFDQWLEEQDIGMCFCAGFISEPTISRNNQRLNYMALFAPWDYPLHRMAYLRGRVAGLVSDTQWAANLWARWLLPPVACVPSLVETGQFAILNQNLPAQPVCIAVTGTLQPRKRQKEAALAVLALLSEGFNIHLNLYGYLMSGFASYIDEIKQLVETTDLKGHVTFHGFVEDVQQIARENHIILSTSADESLPQSIIFNQAAGLLAVACPAGGVEEMVENDVTGYLTRDFSQDSIIDSLRQALESREQWPAVIQRARTRIMERCAAPVFTQRLLQVMLAGAQIQFSEGAKLFPVAETVDTGGHAKLPGRQLPHATGLDVSNLEIGPDLAPQPLRYRVFLEDGSLWGLQFRVGTYLTQPQGVLKIEFTLPDRTRQQIELPLEHISDNTWVKIPMSPAKIPTGGWTWVRISAQLTAGRLAIYETLPLRLRQFHRLFAAAGRRVPNWVGLPRLNPAVYPLQKKH